MQLPPGLEGLLQLPGGSAPIIVAPPGAVDRGGAQGIDCARLEEMARQSGEASRAAGFDPRALMALMGCRPSPPPGPGTPRAASGGADCETYRELLSDFEGLRGDWLGPMPVLAAQALIARCRDTRAAPADHRAWNGLALFADGRFTESAQALQDAAGQAGSLAAHMRYSIEMGKSLLAAGRSGEAQAVFEKALSALSAGGLARARGDEDARERRDALQNELLTVLGIVQLGANNVAAALEHLEQVEKAAQARARAEGVDPGFANLFVRHAPYLALALQRAGRTSEAQRTLDRIVGGREQFVAMADQGRQAMPMVQQVIGAFGLGETVGSELARGAANMDTAQLMSGELSQLTLSCSVLEGLHTSNNAAEAGLEVAERCRGRVLARVLANRAFHRTATTGLPTHGEIEAYARRHKLEWGEAGQALMKERLSNPQAEAASRPATLTDMRRIAAERSATLVVYSISYAPNLLPSRMPDRETGITIWVVAPDGAVHVRRRGFDGILREGTLPLTTAALRAHEALGVPGRGAAASTGAAGRHEPRSSRAAAELRLFHRLLIEPIEDLLPAREGARLMIVPQGPLFLVPFAALEDPQGAPLVARHTVFVTPSLQSMALAQLRRQSARGSGPALVVGNPVMPRYAPAPGRPVIEIPPLPGAEQEAIAVASLLNGTALTGAAATKPEVMSRAREARYVHLATHGFLDDGSGGAAAVNPYLRELGMFDERVGGGYRTPGMLALAPSGRDNGMLTADEIAESTTGAELVVMSACGSGQGVINDDGVIGLSRAWMAAGAPSVLVSLWSIPDEPTRDLMVEFYRRLAAGRPKAEALREAMLAARARYPNPVNWAAFVLVGEPE